MSDPEGANVSRDEVARGAFLAGLSRGGAIIEAVAQPLYIWLFGLAGYGIYVVLWGAISFATSLIDLSLTSALQRIVPTRDDGEAHAAVKLALLATVIPAALVALLVTLNAERVAALFSAAPEDAASLPQAIALFVWALPLWTFVEIATSAARARRAFGPEIRLRIFWEQLARVLFALGFFLVGFGNVGLMAAHLCSVALTAALCLPLLGRYYDLRRLVRTPVSLPLARALLGSGVALLPSNLSRRLLIDAPPLLLNLIIPGAAGARAAGLFEIARKLSTVPYIVRQSFLYVLAPLSSAQARADRAQIGPLYTFATRVSTALVVPLAGLLVFTGPDILSVYRSEAMAALPLLVILSAARAGEAIVGPASAIVEMIGHRALPVLNSLIAAAVWLALAFWLVPAHGEWGMAVAVSIAILASTWAAALELMISDRLWPFDYKLAQGLGLALAGVALMAAWSSAFGGPLRFAGNLTLWAAFSWLALRYGLMAGDRAALGGFARRLRLSR